MAYNIEHIGFSVHQPIEMASWYKKVFGFEILISAREAEKATAFICDPDKNVVLELGQIPGALPLRECLSHRLQFHLALKSDDPDSDAEKFVQNGAKFIEKCPVKKEGECILNLEDPWGNCIQLARRAPGGELVKK